MAPGLPRYDIPAHTGDAPARSPAATPTRAPVRPGPVRIAMNVTFIVIFGDERGIHRFPGPREGRGTARAAARVRVR